MKDVEIRQCRVDELPRLQDFIREHWARNHVLARDRELFSWQHVDSYAAACNYLIAESAGNLLGILGYIRTSRFDPVLADRDMYWVALWKVREDVIAPGLGLRLLNRLIATAGGAPVSVVGIGNLEHNAIYKAMGFELGELTHYFRPASGIENRRIAPLLSVHMQLPIKNGSARLIEAGLDDLTNLEVELEERGRQAPDKSPRYFAERFLKHPRYRYLVHRVMVGGRTRGLIASRLARAWRHLDTNELEVVENATVLRMVDLWLDSTVLAECGPALDDLLQQTGAEYLDCFCHGLNNEAFIAAGLARVESDEHFRIPNYLEPISSSGRRIHFSFRPDGREYVICRADGDQDRPNILSGS